MVLYRSGHPVPSSLPHAICSGCRRPMPDDRIAIHTARGYRFVHASDVTLLRASLKYIEVWTRAGLHGLIEDAIERLARTYPHLLRIHRAMLVDPHAVEATENRPVTKSRDPAYVAFVAGVPDPVPIARREWRNVRRRLDDRR